MKKNKYYQKSFIKLHPVERSIIMENATKERRLPKGISKRADGRYQGRFTFQGERFTLYDRDIKALQIEINLCASICLSTFFYIRHMMMLYLLF